jgi:hypothetical protein
MTDVIELLDQLGRTRVRHAAPAELEQVLAAAGIDAGLRDALISDDPLRLGKLLGAQPNICCLVEKPDQEEEEEEEEEDGDPEDDEEAVRLR